MEDDLTWLVRNVHTWPKCIIDGEHRETLLWIEPSKGDVKAAFSSNPLHCFSRDQWLFRRAKLQNKPSWKDAPEWAEWLAQDKSGAWWFFRRHPKAMSEVWDCDDSAYHHSSWVDGKVLGDWRETLERRPADLSEEAVTERLTESAQVVLAAVPELMDEKFSFDRSDWFERGELPPVGERCVLHAQENNGEEVMFIGVTSDSFPVFETFEKRVFVERGEYKFSPIRTERDEAIEEMKQHCPYQGSWDDVGRIYAEALYDAGYRKQEVKA